MFMELYHTTQTASLFSGTSSPLAIYSMNTEISLISDFTCRVIDKLSHSLASTSWYMSVYAQPRMRRAHFPVSTTQQLRKL